MDNWVDEAIGKALACWMNYSLVSIQNFDFDYFSNLEIIVGKTALLSLFSHIIYLSFR